MGTRHRRPCRWRCVRGGGRPSSPALHAAPRRTWMMARLIWSCIAGSAGLLGSSCGAGVGRVVVAGRRVTRDTGAGRAGAGGSRLAAPAPWRYLQVAKDADEAVTQSDHRDGHCAHGLMPRVGAWTAAAAPQGASGQRLRDTCRTGQSGGTCCRGGAAAPAAPAALCSVPFGGRTIWPHEPQMA